MNGAPTVHKFDQENRLTFGDSRKFLLALFI